LGLHPLNQQCTAKAKSTGERCERRVVGAAVCWVHGLNAPQVRAKQQQRIALAEAQAAVSDVVVVQREPEELLLDALQDTNAVLQQIKSELHGGSVNPVLLHLAGEWLDRLGRLGKVITDGDLSQKLRERIGWLARDRADTLLGHLAAIATAAPLTAADKLRLWESVGDGLRLIERGEMPFRFSDGERRRFTDRLQVEAAREAPLAEGLSWGPDSDVLTEDLPLDGALL
jgi:hypothetical protein